MGERTSVSERTIREDLRVLRSNILDFNAPIICKDGVYRYEDDDFKLFEQTISEKELLLDIQLLLLDEFENIKSQKVKHLLIALAKITGRKIPKKCAPDDNLNVLQKRKPGVKPKPPKPYEVYRKNLQDNILGYEVQKIKEKRKKKSLFDFFKKPTPTTKGFLMWELVLSGLEI